jgi:hypothetical protein
MTYFTTPEVEDLVDVTSRTDGKTLDLTFIRPCIILKKIPYRDIHASMLEEANATISVFRYMILGISMVNSRYI